MRELSLIWYVSGRSIPSDFSHRYYRSATLLRGKRDIPPWTHSSKHDLEDSDGLDCSARMRPRSDRLTHLSVLASSSFKWGPPLACMYGFGPPLKNVCLSTMAKL